MCILYGNDVDLFECVVDFHDMWFKFCLQIFIDGMCVVALAHAAKTISGATFHPLGVMLLMSG